MLRVLHDGSTPREDESVAACDRVGPDDTMKFGCVGSERENYEAIIATRI